MKIFRKVLHIGGYIALAVLFVGIALYMFYWHTDLEICNWAVVNADGEIVETQDIDFYLRRKNYLFKEAEYQTKAFDQPEENRYAYSLPNGDPEIKLRHNLPYAVIWGSYRDRYLDNRYTSYFAISMEKGLFIAKHLDTENYLIGSVKADYDAKEILEFFSDFIDNGCKPW